MAVWQDRLNRGLAKVGTQWVTPQQKTEMASQANTLARQAADLLKQGRNQEAAPLIQQALDADPQNPAALYMRGLSLFAAGQIPLARKSFEAVAAALPDEGSTFNNLGIVLWRQNQQMGAMRFYDMAMAASPVSKTILDNVAEALNALPDDQRRNPLAVRAYKRFVDQDAELQQIMAQSGMHRWGSTWVDQPTLDKLKQAEQEVKDKLDKIAGDVAASKAKIADIDSSIDGNSRAMTQMAANSIARDPKGNLYQAPLPTEYYTMQSDNERLTADRAAQEQKIRSLGEDAKKVQQSMPVPQFTGAQRMIGVEGTPFPPTTAPTTNSSTEPATLPTTAPAAVPLSPPVMMPLP
jgi:tetratricopeptide (TPR) repeat protein